MCGRIPTKNRRLVNILPECVDASLVDHASLLAMKRLYKRVRWTRFNRTL